MATIKDVAREAGVSVGTVSRYINGNKIKDINKKRIDAAIKKLDYSLNSIARYLKTNKTNTIGVVIPDLADIYSTTIVKNIEEKLHEYGYQIIVCGSNNNIKLEQEKVSLLLSKQIDGLIVYSTGCDLGYLNQINKNQIPVIAIDNLIENYSCDQVLSDNVDATYKATEYLISLNHKRIGIISADNEFFTARERLIGYKKALEDNNISIDDQLIQSIGFHKHSGYNGINNLLSLSNPPTAIIACNYYTTVGAYKAIHERSIKLPQQLSFIGWDDIGLTDITVPPLTTIAQPMHEVGIKTAELMIARIESNNTSPTITRFKTKIVVRGTVKKLKP